MERPSLQRKRPTRARLWMVALVSAGFASTATQAANRCVDAKGKSMPLASCADSSLPLAQPGTYSTLPQRPQTTRGPQGKVYESNPASSHPLAHPRTDAAHPAANPNAVAPPVVIELNGANAGTSAAAGNSSGSVAPPGRPGSRHKPTPAK